MSGFFQHVELTTMPLIVLVAFISIFLFVVAWVFRPNSRETYDEMSALPFEANSSDKELK